MCGNLKRMGLKTSQRGSCSSEKVNICPKRTLLEGEETGRKSSGCVGRMRTPGNTSDRKMSSEEK